MGIDSVLPLVLGISVLSLIVAAGLARQVLRADTGKPEMRAISDSIREGAQAFLARQYRTIAVLAILAAAAIFGFYFSNRDVPNIAEMGQGTAWKVTISSSSRRMSEIWRSRSAFSTATWSAVAVSSMRRFSSLRSCCSSCWRRTHP